MRRPQSTRLVTASEDDVSPVILLWDLRNARAPENVCIVLRGIDMGLTLDCSDPQRSRQRYPFIIMVQAGRKSPAFLW